MSDKAALRHFTKNHILNALPDEDYNRIHLHLEPVHLTLGQIIYRPDEPISHVYFPGSAMASIIATTADGQSAEIGVIGREGMVGIDVLMGVNSTPYETIIQISDGALRIGTEIIRKEFKENATFNKLLLRFMHAFLVQVGQTALCNRLHSIEQRLSRWLLMCHDRAETDKLKLTQEFLSIMLGVNRPSVTVAAITLQSAGFIKYSRGNITILDRAGIEDFACDCYQIVKKEYAGLPK